MTQARAALVPSAYLALTRPAGDGREVLLQLREGTGYMDGWWACGAAGHVEPRESVHRAAVREAEEELGVRVAECDLVPVVTMQRTCALPDPLEQRLDVFLQVTRWQGTPRVAEPHRSAGLRWWPLEDLPTTLVPHERQALEAMRDRPGHSLLTRGFDQRLTLVAALGRNRVIGDGEAMPWHLPEDLAHFKRTTQGGVMVMGRGTWDSIGRALPGRRTVVLTRDRTWSAPGAQVAHSLAEALLVAGDGEVFVVGGGEVYARTIDHATRLVLTEVDRSPQGSVLFPRVDAGRWQETSRERRDGFSWVTYGPR